ncbi:hypothetical protein SAMN05519105_4540 [Rhodobacter sp. 24-YEA-8]|nr:hypothetical protein SAMN05519105_4540 [Rhodobacter sp. 24-YEA-8]
MDGLDKRQQDSNTIEKEFCADICDDQRFSLNSAGNFMAICMEIFIHQ